MVPYPKGIPYAGLFYQRAQQFFRIFQNGFGVGFLHVDGTEIANTDNIGALLTNYHISIELLLKALLCLRSIPFEKIHNLLKLLDAVEASYGILLSVEMRLLLQELGSSFDHIRYSEGMICLGTNKRKGWADKHPLEELTKLLYDAFLVLDKVFKDKR